MPPVIAYVADLVVQLAFEMGASFTVAGYVAYAAQAILTIAALAGAQKILAHYSKSAGSTQLVDHNQLIKGTIVPRDLVYGRVQKSGVLCYVQQSGANNGDLYMLVVLAANRCDGIDQFNLNNYSVEMDGSGNVVSETNLNSGAVTTNFAGKAAIWTKDSGGNYHFGSVTQTVDPLLQTAAGSTVWPNAAKLSGCCYVVHHFIYDQKVFGSGVPNPSYIVRGKPIVDPRTAYMPTGSITSATNTLTVSSVTGLAGGQYVIGPGLPLDTTIVSIAGSVLTLSAYATSTAASETYLIGTPAFTSNPVLCVMDYMMNQRFGMKSKPSEFDLSSLIASANNCDESILLNDGSHEPRYTLNTVIDTSQTPSSIIQMMLTSMAGKIVWAGGQWFIYSGYHRAPTVTLSENDFRDTPQIPTMPSRRDVINSCKGLFVCPQQFWQSTDFPSYQNSTYIAADQNEILWLDLNLPCTTSAATAQRLAKIQVLTARTGTITMTLNCKLTAMTVQCGDNIYINYARMGWTNQMFEVVGFTFAAYNDSEGKPTLGINLNLRGTAATIYDWTAGSDTPLPVGPTSTLPNPFVVANPAGLALLTDSSTSITQSDGTFVPRLKVTWNTSGDSFVDNGGQAIVEYKKHSSGIWIQWSSLQGTTLIDYITDVKVGDAMDVRVTFVNNLGWRSVTPAEVDNYTIAGDVAAPATPAGLSATVGTGKVVKLSWTANTEPDLLGYKILRSTTNNMSTAALIAFISATTFIDVGVAMSTQYFYWIEAVDDSNNVSTAFPTQFAGVAATPTGVATGGTVTAPTASIQTNTISYLTTDGTVLSSEQFTIRGLPAGAVGQQLEYKKHADSTYIIAGEYSNSADLTGVIVPDLAPGTSYDFRVTAYNSFGDTATTPVTGTPFTTTNGPVPATPTGLTTSITDADTSFAPPRYDTPGLGQNKMGVFKASWTASTSLDVDHYEIVIINTVGVAGPSDDIYLRTKGTETSVFCYNTFAASGTPPFYTSTVFVRAVSRSGVVSGYASTGAFTTYNYGTQNMAEQDKSAVNVTGGQAILGGLQANVTTAVDVRGVNFRIYDGSAVQQMRVDYTTGHVYIQGTQVLSTRQPTPTTLPDVISVLQAHGLSS